MERLFIKIIPEQKEDAKDPYYDMFLGEERRWLGSMRKSLIDLKDKEKFEVIIE